MANLDWLVVRDFVLIESATWWQNGPEIETGEMRTEDIKTEVFFMPAAAHTEKNGSFTNTQRMLQWHHTAVEPAGDARSDLWFTYHLGLRIRAKLAAAARSAADAETSWPPRPRWTGRSWISPGTTRPTGPLDEPDADAVLAEINGWDAEGKPLSSYTQLKSDGSTAAGCWIYCGVRADGVNQAARRKPGREQNWVANEWGWAWPANRRVLYNRASADPDGKPWSERKALVWWDEENGKWTGHDIPDFVADRPPSYRPPDGATGVAAISGIDPFIMQADGKAWLFTPAGLVDGPLPAHYEPQESPLPNLLYRQQHNPVREIIAHPQNRFQPSGAEPGSEVFPYVEHHLPAHRASHGGRDVALPALPGRAAARVLLRGVARAGGRAGPGAHGLGDDHHRAQRDRGPGDGHPPDEAAAARAARPMHQVGLPWHWGPNGLTTGDAANELSHLSLDPNVHIQEVKALACDIRPGRRPRGPALRDLIRSYQQRAGITDETGTQAMTRTASHTSANSAATKTIRRWPRLAPLGMTRRHTRAIGSTRPGWASSPTPRCASAARPARWPARRGTRCPRTG